MHPKTIYYIFTSLYALAFSIDSAAYTPFMHSIGLSFTQMEIVNTAFIASQLLSEIPTGMWADRRGRRWSLTMGALISGIGFTLYAFATGFFSALLAEITIGIGFAFVSGAAQAWVTDALHERGEHALVRPTIGHASSFRWTTSLLAGIAGAFVAGHVSLRAPWFLSALAMFTLLVFVRFAMKPGIGESSENMTEAEALRVSMDLIRKDKALLWVAGITIVAGLAASMNHFWQPYFLVHLPQAHLGIVWACVCVGSIVGGQIVARTKHRPRQEITYSLFATILVAMSLIGLATSSSLFAALSWVVIHNIGRGGIVPVVDAYVQHRIGSGYRATFGSFLSMFRQGGAGIAFILSGALAYGLPYGAETVRHVWIWVGSIMLVSILILFAFRPKNGKG